MEVGVEWPRLLVSESQDISQWRHCWMNSQMMTSDESAQEQ